MSAQQILHRCLPVDEPTTLTVRALTAFFTGRGLALPDDQAQQRAAARRQRYLDAIPAPLRPAVIAFDRAQLDERDRDRRAGRRQLSDITLATRLRILRDLAKHLVNARHITPGDITNVLAQIPAGVWTPAYDADGKVRDGAWVTELTGLLDLSGWPEGMRVIARKERPHPGAQLRLTDVDGCRVTAFATNTRRGQLADRELRHRRRARAEDRIRNGKDTGLTNLPLHDFNQNRIWCAVVSLAAEITAWTQLLGLTRHQARRWEPKRLRYRLFTVPALLARTGRQLRLHLADHHPWAGLAVAAAHRLRALAVPG